MEIRVADKNDIEDIVKQTASGNWGSDNEINQYDQIVLLKFFENEMNLLILVWEDKTIVGMALCYRLLHPNGQEYSLYVHELDTHPKFRRRKIATSLLNYLFEYAKVNKLTEVWLTTEPENTPANRLYKSAKPTEITNSVLYGYETK